MTISVGRGTWHVFSQFEPLHTTVDEHWTITICDTISKNTTSTYSATSVILELPALSKHGMDFIHAKQFHSNRTDKKRPEGFQWRQGTWTCAE